METQVNQKYNEVKAVFQKELDNAIKATIDLHPDRCLPLRNNAAEEFLTEDSLKAAFENAASKPFTIAICGKVKAGKSTLLNALIFGDKILPSFITPETAKLAFIRYTNENSYFKVNWYDENEWRDVKETSDKESLNKRVSYSSKKHGVNKQNCIGKSSEKICDLLTLDRYTSVPKDDEEEEDSLAGIYTPYVKSVEIYINNENLKDLQIVDTPGLNDPNRINSNETTKWLKEAHAVIYVCDVTLFHTPDLEFFRDFMQGRTEESRIIVQNRIDEERDTYKSVIDACCNNSSLKQLGLFGKNEIVCSYSAMLKLARTKNAKGKADKKDLRYIERYKDFQDDPDNLEQKISERLFNNSGRARIESLAGICINPYTAQKAFVDEEIKVLEFKKIKYNDPIEKVQKELKRLNEKQKEIKKRVCDASDKFDKEQRMFSDSLNKIVDNDKNCKDLIEFANTKYSEGKYDRVNANIGHEWNQKTTELCRILEKESYSKITHLQDEMRDEVDRLIDNIVTTVGKEVKEIIINYTKLDWNPPKPEKIQLDESHWYTFKSTELSQIQKNINDAWDAFIDKLRDYVDAVKIRLEHVTTLTFDEILRKLRIIEEALEERVKSNNDYNNKVKEIESSIEKKKAEIETYNQKIREINQLAKKYKESV